MPSFQVNFIDRFENACNLKDKDGRPLDIFDFEKANISCEKFDENDKKKYEV